MIDWQRHEGTLRTGSRKALSTFLVEHPLPSVCAVGYVFELWGNSPQFDLCAETHAHRRRLTAEHVASHPGASTDDNRWNSGNFEYPAGLLRAEELGPEWNAAMTSLHQSAADPEFSDSVYEGLVVIACEALTALAVEGFFGDSWWGLDFNISEVNDDIAAVRARSQQIHARIGASRTTRG